MVKEIAAAQAAFIENGKTLLTEEFKKFFEVNPGIAKFTWTQYSPYFNDGDECVFSVNYPTFTNDADGEIEYDELESELEDSWLYGEDAYGEYSGTPTAAEEAAMDELTGLWGFSVMDDLFEALFGNHVRVTATKEGISVDEYSHD